MLTFSHRYATQTPLWVGRLFGSQVNHVGIDIGIDSVKVATLGSPMDSRGSSVQWSAQSEFQLPVDPMESAPEGWLQLVIEQLHERLPRSVPGDQNRAWISLPLPWVHYQTSIGEELETNRVQCNEMFQTSLFQSNAHCVHWPIGPTSGTRILAATAEDAALRIADAVARNGYVVKGILPHGVALTAAATTLTSLDPAAVL